MAEVSSERLRKRISKLQTYRDTLKSYSDRAVYLGALLAIVAMLIFMCMAGLVILADTLGVLDGGRVMGACILAYAIGVGMAILRSYALTTDIKTTFGRAIARLDEDISALQRKLANRTQ
jgi:hypothetical protein